MSNNVSAIQGTSMVDTPTIMAANVAACTALLPSNYTKANMANQDNRYALLKKWGIVEPVAFMDVSPEMAVDLLMLNQRNRNLADSRVQDYQYAMMAGTWWLGPTAITFGSDGNLSNGQYRLNSVIKSKTTQRFIIALGIDSFDDMDTGKMRTAFDQIVMNKVGDVPGCPDQYANIRTPKVVGMIRALARYKCKSGFRLLNSEVIRLFDREKDNLQIMLNLFGGFIGDVWVNAALYAAYIGQDITGNHVDDIKIMEFKNLYSQRGMSSSPCVDSLYKYIHEWLAGAGSDSHAREKFNCTQYALYQYLLGNTQAIDNQDFQNRAKMVPLWDYDVSFLNMADDGSIVSSKFSNNIRYPKTATVAP